MLNLLFNEKFIKNLAQKLSIEVKTTLSEENKEHSNKLDLVLNNIEKLSLELKTLEQRLTTKELKDRMDYGQLQYQVNSLQTDLKPKRKQRKEIDSSH